MIRMIQPLLFDFIVSNARLCQREHCAKKPTPYPQKRKRRTSSSESRKDCPRIKETKIFLILI